MTKSSPIQMPPSVISSSPAIIRSAVDLPQPEGPTHEELAVLDVEAQFVDRPQLAAGIGLGNFLEGNARHGMPYLKPVVAMPRVSSRWLARKKPRTGPMETSTMAKRPPKEDCPPLGSRNSLSATGTVMRSMSVR